MSNVEWSDWGRPERIISALKEIGKVPSFPIEEVASIDLIQNVPNGAMQVAHKIGDPI